MIDRRTFSAAVAAGVAASLVSRSSQAQDRPAEALDRARVDTGITLARGNLGLNLGVVWTSVPWDNLEDQKYQSYGRIGFSWSY